MQINSTTQNKAPAATIPAHVLERMESEWRQMRQSAPQPAPASK